MRSSENGDGCAYHVTPTKTWQDVGTVPGTWRLTLTSSVEELVRTSWEAYQLA